MPFTPNEIQAMSLLDLINNLDPFFKIKQGLQLQSVIEEQYQIALRMIEYLNQPAITYLPAIEKAELFLKIMQTMLEAKQYHTAEMYCDQAKQQLKYLTENNQRESKLCVRLATLSGCLHRELYKDYSLALAILDIGFNSVLHCTEDPDYNVLITYLAYEKAQTYYVNGEFSDAYEWAQLALYAAQKDPHRLKNFIIQATNYLATAGASEADLLLSYVQHFEESNEDLSYIANGLTPERARKQAENLLIFADQTYIAVHFTYHQEPYTILAESRNYFEHLFQWALFKLQVKQNHQALELLEECLSLDGCLSRGTGGMQCAEIQEAICRCKIGLEDYVGAEKALKSAKEMDGKNIAASYRWQRLENEIKKQQRKLVYTWPLFKPISPTCRYSTESNTPMWTRSR